MARYVYILSTNKFSIFSNDYVYYKCHLDRYVPVREPRTPICVRRSKVARLPVELNVRSVARSAIARCVREQSKYIIVLDNIHTYCILS